MTLDLKELASLPGAADQNLEALTRAVVTRRFGALGTLRERRNQPGVEFYLRVDHPGALGDPGRVWGWSCKWFILNAKNELTKGQRDQIEDSIAKAITYVAGLTDFVLCLPERPAKVDLDWIDALDASADISIRLWTSENYEAELAGFDELRSTFFGELVLTPLALATSHERSVAPISARWIPPLHTSNHVQRQLERALLRPSSVADLNDQIAGLAARVAVLRKALDDMDDVSVRGSAEGIVADLDQFVSEVRAVVGAVHDRRPLEARQRIADQQPPATSPRKLRAVVLELRKRRLPAALVVTGLAADIRDVVWWLQDAHSDAEAPLIAVVAAAGLGKTHLAAQLTAPTDQPTAGVFIQGGRLPAGGTLDDLARRIPGAKIARFEDLLEGLDSAGARAGVRIPLVIDGLNEAERPSEWHGLLAELVPALGRYPHVLVAVTARERLATRAIPVEALTIELEWFQSEVDDIVDAYFDHYQIDPGGAWLPRGLFRNPLFLRIYCETANPRRDRPVGVETLPTSLVGLFERYRDVVAERLAEDPSRIHIPADQIKRRLASLATEMWTRGLRRIASDEARQLLDAGESNWDESLFRRLEEDGVLFREDVVGSDDTAVGVLFDRFAGYLIADALLGRMAYNDVSEQLADGAFWDLLFGDTSRPLGDDVAVALVGLLPRRFGGHHLWKLAPTTYRVPALVQELDLESDLLDDDTCDELKSMVVGWPPPRYSGRHPFDRLWETRASPAHRLNADFLDSVLRRLSMPERDRTWTEWIRHRADDELVPELNELVRFWSDEVVRSDTDDLNARSVAWLLSSTDEAVRDVATKALQRNGRPIPGRLFALATGMLAVDDPYVVERVIGAAFGAVTAHQMPDPGGPFEQALRAWLVELQGRYLEGGSSPTSHELLRTYVRATFEFAGTLHPSAVPEGVHPFDLAFAPVSPAPVMAEDDPNAAECDSTFGMDFENYVIGSVIEGRANYDFKHPDFRRARAEVMARVWELGWRSALLGDPDRSIADSSSRFGRERKTERYGKKYGWIAFYELVGRLADAGRIRDRRVGGGRSVSPGLDISFPDEPSVAPLPLPEWSPAGSLSDVGWLRSGTVEVPDALWSPEQLHDAPGWLLVEGFLEHRRDGRRVWGFFRTLLLEPPDVDEALQLIAEREYLGNDFLPDLPTVRGVFAGEMPWSQRFKVGYDDEDSEFRPALRSDWQDDGIDVGHLGVELATGEGGSPTALSWSYDVPAFEVAKHLALRQLPGTLDLVGLDGHRASATFRTVPPWRGRLLFMRRELVVAFAEPRRIVQVGWGEREVTVEWGAVPAWVQEVHQQHANLWREVRVLDGQGDAL